MTGERAANTLALTPSLVPPAAPKMAAKMWNEFNFFNGHYRISMATILAGTITSTPPLNRNRWARFPKTFTHFSTRRDAFPLAWHAVRLFVRFHFLYCFALPSFQVMITLFVSSQCAVTAFKCLQQTVDTHWTNLCLSGALIHLAQCATRTPNACSLCSVHCIVAQSVCKSANIEFLYKMCMIISLT